MIRSTYFDSSDYSGDHDAYTSYMVFVYLNILHRTKLRTNHAGGALLIGKKAFKQTIAEQCHRCLFVLIYLFSCHRLSK